MTEEERNNRGSRRECSYVEGRTTLSEHYTRQSVYYTFSFLISSIKLLYILKLDILVFAGPRGFDSRNRERDRARVRSIALAQARSIAIVFHIGGERARERSRYYDRLRQRSRSRARLLARSIAIVFDIGSERARERSRDCDRLR